MKRIYKIVFAIFVLFLGITACSSSSNAYTEQIYRYQKDGYFQRFETEGGYFYIGKITDTIDGYEFAVIVKGDGVGITQIIENTE